MPWLITKITDLGRRSKYRWYVEGMNTEGASPHPINWTVPSVADDRYQPAPGVDDDTLRGILVAKVICAPPPALRSWKDKTPAEILAAMNALVDDLPTAAEQGHRPCLACAREECAAAGYPGIDREQRGHTCRAYTLDGEPLADLEDFIRENTDPDAPGLSTEQVAEIKHMVPGDSLLLGGGAGEMFTLKRTR